ncbi:MAG: type III-B CRISPR-associated protein Cas10/Cmr2 [Labilithrix sp.]|nr:type III-B CRISPR-associated protein Cas10/Cmr2 [Labilithrix sp.]MBX3216452.1 type III-B CRISPR-associated protein Cas10/Cmr2 [Labilithrix sp.]
MTRHLHVAIGPVQGFVSQSRRTRDLWGSSYMLSFLAAHAMKGTTQFGSIVRPRVAEDPMLRWVTGGQTGDPPRLGSLPNQFTVELEDDVDPSTAAAAAESAFRSAWVRICLAVWEHHVAGAAALGGETEKIWERQTTGFWELAWVVGAPAERGLLAARKQWRTHWLPEEGGDKCTVMPDLQEVSGHVRARASRAQDAFWDAVRKRAGDLDVREKERLCAIALVKRLAPRRPDVAHKAFGWPIDVSHWPSTVDVAAAGWCRRVIEETPAPAEAFANAVSSASDEARTGGVSVLIGDDAARAPAFSRLDANWFHRAFLASPALTRIAEEGTRSSLVRARAAIRPHGPPIYFALLLADGDSLGEVLAKHDSAKVSNALATFTRAVPGIVSRRHGVTIYAGGDDVLAMLPLEEALSCAEELEAEYRRSFDDAVATLSLGIVLAHARDPLNRILAEAHRLLDDVAKTRNGRDSLGVSLYRRGSVAAEWVSTWRRPATNLAQNHAARCMNAFVRELAIEGAALSRSLLHDLAGIFGQLSPAPLTPGALVSLDDGIDVRSLVRAEIAHRSAHRDEAFAEAELERLTAIVSGVLACARRDEPPESAARHVSLDGLTIASLLASGGVEDEHLP